MTKPKLIKLARLIERERELSKQSKALRDLTNGNGGYYTTVTFHGNEGKLNAITLQVTEAEWLQAELPAGIERPKPELQEFRGEHFPKPYGRLFYPAIWVGEFAPGKHLWIQASSEKFDLPVTEQPIAVVSHEVAEAFGMSALHNVVIAYPMKTSFTPGPWRIVRDDDGCFEIADDNGLLINKTVARGGTVNRANARLIAAAPDLLLALQNAETILRTLVLSIAFQPRPNDPLSAQAELALDNARAEILKATTP